MTRPVWVIPALLLGGLIAAGGVLLISTQSKSATQSAPASAPAEVAASRVSETVVADIAAPPKPHTIDAPLDLVPAEHLLCWKGAPFPGLAPQSTQPSPLQTMLDLAGKIFGGQLDEGQRLGLRILETLGIVGRYPFAVTVIDAAAKSTRPDGSGAKLDQLRIAAVIQTGGLTDSDPFLRIIQKAINELTDAGAAQLTTQTAGQWQYQKLTDERLPAWCEIAWGQIEKHFVLTFGRDVWPEIAAVAAGDKPAAVEVDWVRDVRHSQEGEPLIEVLVSARKIRERLDPFVRGRATAFFEAWRIEDVEFMHWAIGFQEHALYCAANYREGNITTRSLYADPDIRDERFLETIPEDARYAIFRISAQRFLPTLISSIYATLDPDERETAGAAWKKIQDDLNIDAERDALNHLGDTMIAHNYPPNPFNLPLEFTALIEIKEEPARVRATLEKLLEAWRAALETHADETGRQPLLRLYRDDDGIWHGSLCVIHGVAWTFTDRYIVTSWSPNALREYMDKMGDKLGKRE
jgi:hypothetical protein